jgi:quercetin dioxygenase-like cupin family protein
MHGSRYCQVPGPIVVHCVEGEIELKTKEKTIRLKGGQLVYLLGQTDHAISGIEDSIALLMIVLRPG